VRRTAHDPFARALALGGVGVVVAVAVHNLFEDLHVLSLGVHLSAVWALLAAIRAYAPISGPSPRLPEQREAPL